MRSTIFILFLISFALATPDLKEKDIRGHPGDLGWRNRDDSRGDDQPNPWDHKDWHRKDWDRDCKDPSQGILFVNH